MPRIKYQDKGKDWCKSTLYFDFCEECWATIDNWFDDFIADDRDMDLDSLEYAVPHQDYKELEGYTCLRCNKELSDADN